MPYANCQSATGGRVDLKEVLPRVVQDLRQCDLVKAENDVLKKYNGTLQAIAQSAQAQTASARQDADQQKTRARRRLKTIVIQAVVIAAETATIILIAR